MKAVFRGVYNFFHMFRKDSGAHFTYNLGVGMIRLSLMFVLWALVITAEWFFLSSPKFVYAATEEGEVKEIASLGDGIYTARFEMMPKEAPVYEHTQYVTRKTADSLRNGGLFLSGNTFHVYRLRGRGIKHGEDYGLFISRSSEIVAEWQYFFATPGARPPVQTWGIWASLGFSALLFMLGRRQIQLSMKYPRSDVPHDLMSAPVPLFGADDRCCGAAEAAVRENMDAAARLLLSDGETKEASDVDKETDP